MLLEPPKIIFFKIDFIGLKRPKRQTSQTNVIYGQVLREKSDEFCDAQKSHTCTFMPF